MNVVNYQVIFHIPVNLKHDAYVVSSENFLEHFNRLFESYEDMGVDFSVEIRHTDTQIII